MSTIRRKQLEELRTHLLQLRKDLELQKARLGYHLPPSLELNLSEIYHSLERTNQELARLPPSDSTTIVCSTIETPTPPALNQLELDWHDYFHRQQPSFEVWNTRLWKELLAFRQKIHVQASKDLVLCVYGPISLALALGYIAESLANYRIWIESEGIWWQNEQASEDRALLGLCVSQQAPVEQVAISIEMDLLASSERSSNLNEQVSQTINQLELPISTRFQLRLQQDQAIKNAWQIQAITEQIHTLLSEIRQKDTQSLIHLFIASSSAIAATIGCKLVGFEPVQCYELHPEQQIFMPTCVINSTF